MKKRSDWMEGLLWAEDYIDKGVFFENDETGVDSLHWELYYSGEYFANDNVEVEWFKGAEDYLENLKRVNNEN